MSSAKESSRTIPKKRSHVHFQRDFVSALADAASFAAWLCFWTGGSRHFRCASLQAIRQSGNQAVDQV